MSGPSVILTQIKDTLRPHGLTTRGVVAFSGDGPKLAGGGRAACVVLVGHAGSSFWSAFRAWQRSQDHGGGKDPLDTWSKAVIEPLAQILDATAYYPSDAPYQPFQHWAMQAEGIKASPLGILIHPDYGLWHGYRGAIGLATPLPQSDVQVPPVHPCDTCEGKPCIAGCPAAALEGEIFDVGRCRSYLAGPAGQGGCMAHGCAARAACPVGSSYRYEPDQLRFHMQALSIIVRQ
ncbi:ferredoxin [Rhizobium sp. RU36D]|uniref:ferredoxin n=1 Tax=Rhizobium sp. RU36D TaxID=1907415 RepID=UPI0009D81CE3|nr:ferredoxin [Rhizobium sp. RU36D]SMD14427.1 Ferredoxin [Rhizobium sp. RU36D]